MKSELGVLNVLTKVNSIFLVVMNAIKAIPNITTPEKIFQNSKGFEAMTSLAVAMPNLLVQQHASGLSWCIAKPVHGDHGVTSLSTLKISFKVYSQLH